MKYEFNHNIDFKTKRFLESLSVNINFTSVLVIIVDHEPSWTTIIKSALDLKYHLRLREMIKFPRNGYFQKIFILFFFLSLSSSGTNRTSASNKTDHPMAPKNWTFSLKLNLYHHIFIWSRLHSLLLDRVLLLFWV